MNNGISKQTPDEKLIIFAVEICICFEFVSYTITGLFLDDLHPLSVFTSLTSSSVTELLIVELVRLTTIARLYRFPGKAKGKGFG